MNVLSLSKNGQGCCPLLLSLSPSLSLVTLFPLLSGGGGQSKLWAPAGSAYWFPALQPMCLLLI